MEAMRRLCATLLLALFSFVLGGPALFADTDSNLPACCRRLGQHHCTLVSPEQTSGPAIRLAPCASFPNALATPVSAKAGLRKAPCDVTAPVDVYADGRVLPGVQCRATARDSHSERGPPAFLS